MANNGAPVDNDNMDDMANTITNRCLFCHRETDEINIGEDSFIICEECAAVKA